MLTHCTKQFQFPWKSSTVAAFLSPHFVWFRLYSIQDDRHCNWSFLRAPRSSIGFIAIARPPIKARAIKPPISHQSLGRVDPFIFLFPGPSSYLLPEAAEAELLCMTKNSSRHTRWTRVTASPSSPPHPAADVAATGAVLRHPPVQLVWMLVKWSIVNQSGTENYRQLFGYPRRRSIPGNPFHFQHLYANAQEKSQEEQSFGFRGKEPEAIDGILHFSSWFVLRQLKIIKIVNLWFNSSSPPCLVLIALGGKRRITLSIATIGCNFLLQIRQPNYHIEHGTNTLLNSLSCTAAFVA